MNTNDTTTNTNETQAAIDAGVLITPPQPLDTAGRLYSVTVPAGARHQVLDIEDYLDSYHDRPRRKSGNYTLHTATSLIAYLDKHALPETEIWADVNQSRIVAVINAHGEPDDTGNHEGPAGWGDHRATLTLRKTPAWTAWLTHNEQWLSQIQLAEHIENRAIDVTSPPSAQLLEIAQTFTAARRVTFESGERLSTGEVQFEYREDTDAKAGRKGNLTMPEQIGLVLQPYEGSKTYQVTARLRWRIDAQQLKLSYAIDRPDDILATAFTDIVDAVANETDRTILHGTPA